MSGNDQGAQGEPAPFGGLIPGDFEFGEGGAPAHLAPLTAGLSERFSALESSISGLRSDVIRNRKRTQDRKPEGKPESGQPPAAPAPEPAPALSRAEQRAFDRLLASLPEEQATMIDDAIDDGMSPGHARRWAESLKQSGAGSAPSPKPSGAAASAAQVSAPQYPRSLQEYQQIAEKDPKRFDALCADPDFDPSALPYSVR